MHPETEGQSMDLSQPHWPNPELVGSAAGPLFVPALELADLVEIIENGAELELSDAEEAEAASREQRANGHLSSHLNK